MNIDWDRIDGVTTRADSQNNAPEFTQEDINQALAAVEALPALDPADSDTVATFWPIVTKFGLQDLDFRGVTVTEVTLADLSASNQDLSREKLEEHVENPGEAKNETPLDAYPIVLQSNKKQTIIDGHHRLAALMLLGATTWTVYLVPK